MPTEIRCESRSSNGATCGRFLAEIDGCTLYILCPVCRKKHAVELTELIAHLDEWLAQVKAKQEGGQGFML